jgi:hypothetical protein
MPIPIYLPQRYAPVSGFFFFYATPHCAASRMMFGCAVSEEKC